MRSSVRTGRQPGLARAVGILSTGQLLGRFVSFGWVFFLARQLPVEEFGRFNGALAAIAFFSILADTGVAPVLQREVALNTRAARDLLVPAAALSFSGNLLLLLLLVFTASTLYPPRTAELIPFVAILLFTNALTGLILPLARCAGAYAVESLTGLAGQALFIALAVAALAGGLAVPGLVGARVLVSIATSVGAAAYVLWRYPEFRPARWKPSVSTGLLRKGLPLAIASSFAAVYLRFDAVCILVARGEYEAGVYAAAYRFIELATLFMGSLAAALGPSVSRSQRDPAATARLLGAVSLATVIAASVAMLAGTFLAQDVVVLIYGEAYANSVTPLILMSVALPAFFVSAVLNVVLIHTARGKQSVQANGLGAAINVGANLLLVPGYGATGAAIALLLTYGGMSVVSGWMLRDYLVRYARPATKIAVAAGLAALAAAIPPTNPFARSGLALTAFAMGLAMLRPLGRAEVGILLSSAAPTPRTGLELT